MLDASTLDTGPQPETEGLPPRLAVALDEHVRTGRLDLPLLPTIAAELMRAAGSELADAHQVANIARRDPATAAHLLRVANSPLYRGAVQIVSLQQAVSRLGMATVRQVAVAIACESRIFRAPGFETEMRDMFRHSLACGIAAQELARSLKSSVEDAFLCGLLHDVGKPVLLQKLIDLQKKLGVSAPPHGAMLAALERHHANVGAQLARAWQFPPKLGQAIQYHHDATPPTSSGNGPLLTSLADTISHFVLEDGSATEADVRAHRTLAQLAAYPNVIDGVLAKADKIRATAMELS